jgi:hypothetical protein
VAVPHSPASPSGVQALKRVPSAPLPRASGRQQGSRAHICAVAAERRRGSTSVAVATSASEDQVAGGVGNMPPAGRLPQRAPCTARAARRHLRPRQRPPLRPSQSPHKAPRLPRRLPLLCCHPVASSYWRRYWGANASRSSLHPSAFRRQTHASAPARQPQCRR